MVRLVWGKWFALFRILSLFLLLFDYFWLMTPDLWDLLLLSELTLRPDSRRSWFFDDRSTPIFDDFVQFTDLFVDLSQFVVIFLYDFVGVNTGNWWFVFSFFEKSEIFDYSVDCMFEGCLLFELQLLVELLNFLQILISLFLESFEWFIDLFCHYFEALHVECLMCSIFEFI